MAGPRGPSFLDPLSTDSHVNAMTVSSPTPKESLQQLVLDEDLERLEDLLAEFNLFEVLKIERRETQHSALLAWLLNPRGSHGLRDYFIRRFLLEVTSEGFQLGLVDVSPIDVDGWSLEDIEVATERHNIDILLINENDGFVCLIENKIGSGEHSNQLSRYLNTVEQEYDGLTPLAIYLTPEGNNPGTEKDAKRYIPLSYEVVASLIERTLQTRQSTMSAGVASFLEQYGRTLRRSVLDTTDNISELALQVYEKHRHAIDLIVGAKSQSTTKNWDIIDSAIAEREPLLLPDYHRQAYHRYFAPALEDITELKGGHGWTSSGRILLFEVRYSQGRFVLLIGPGPEQTRRKIYDMVQRGEVKGVDMRLARNLSNSWHAIYSKSISDTSGPSSPDYQKSRIFMEGVLSRFFDGHYWPIVNAIRKEFGLAEIPGQ